MDAFTRHTAPALVLDRANVDTDLIIPARHLKTISRLGLGRWAFEGVRYEGDGSIKADSPFDGPGMAGKTILIAGDNFGCGSSREHAVWALMDYGLRAVIAPSFADIFRSNCVKNGLLTVAISEEDRQKLITATQIGEALTIDLPAQTVTTAGGVEVSFPYSATHKERLLKGLDDIALTLALEAEISAFEVAQKNRQPWLYKRVY